MARMGIPCLVLGFWMPGVSEMSLFVNLQSSSSKLSTNDQFLSLTDQLNLGVRAVELDTHWVEVSTQVLTPVKMFHSLAENAEDTLMRAGSAS